MKINPFSVYIASFALLSTLMTSQATAQTASKLRNDPTYSVRNYKHPNKAAAARQWEPQASLTVDGRNAQWTTIGDYKRIANRDSILAVSVPTMGPSPVTNYKTPRPSLSSPVRLPAEPKPTQPKVDHRPVTDGERPILP